eukprot:Pgem_evm1s8493
MKVKFSDILFITIGSIVLYNDNIFQIPTATACGGFLQHTSQKPEIVWNGETLPLDLTRKWRGGFNKKVESDLRKRTKVEFKPWKSYQSTCKQKLVIRYQEQCDALKGKGVGEPTVTNGIRKWHCTHVVSVVLEADGHMETWERKEAELLIASK